LKSTNWPLSIFSIENFSIVLLKSKKKRFGLKKLIAKLEGSKGKNPKAKTP
jgi:hypothetical protein